MLLQLVKNLFYSIRPSACLGVALFATAALGQWHDWLMVFLVFSAGFVGSAGCFLINDLFDREKDLKNNKLRPIATGELPASVAFVMAVFCCGYLLVASLFASMDTFAAASVLVVCFWLYSYINQHFGLLANIWVSVCSALAFFGGSTVYGMTKWILLAMSVTLFVNTAREILLDGLDQKGDKAVGKPSIPLGFGEPVTVKVVGLLYLLGSIVLAVFTYWFPDHWVWTLVLVLAIWLPYFYRSNDFHTWALFNVRASHLFFAILILLLFFSPQ